MKQKHILLIGSGAREHVIAQTIKRTSKQESQLYCYGSSLNPGISAICKDYIATRSG